MSEKDFREKIKLEIMDAKISDVVPLTGEFFKSVEFHSYGLLYSWVATLFDDTTMRPNNFNKMIFFRTLSGAKRNFINKL